MSSLSLFLYSTFTGGVKGEGSSLLRGVVGKGDTLADVALKTGDSSFQQLLLLVGDRRQDVNGLLGSVGLEILRSA